MYVCDRHTVTYDLETCAHIYICWPCTYVSISIYKLSVTENALAIKD